MVTDWKWMNAGTTGDSANWKSRPLAAYAVRVGLRLLPFLLVTFVAWRVHLVLGPAGSRLEAVATWAALSAASTAAIIGIDRSTRRLLPLATLLKLSIRVPRRGSVAIPDSIEARNHQGPGSAR